MHITSLKSSGFWKFGNFHQCKNVKLPGSILCIPEDLRYEFQDFRNLELSALFIYFRLVEKKIFTISIFSFIWTYVYTFQAIPFYPPPNPLIQTWPTANPTMLDPSMVSTVSLCFFTLFYINLLHSG